MRSVGGWGIFLGKIMIFVLTQPRAGVRWYTLLFRGIEGDVRGVISFYTRKGEEYLRLMIKNMGIVRRGRGRGQILGEGGKCFLSLPFQCHRNWGKSDL